MGVDISRRRFFRHASTGAVAAGVLAIGGTGTLAAVKQSEGTSDGPLLEGSDVIAHVLDAKKGTISILVGTRSITYTNRDMAQQLLRATQ